MEQIENYIWIQKQFKDVNLTDIRLTNRLEMLACRMITKPNLSIPKQNKEWKNIKAAYRFYDSDKVHFIELIQPHINQTKKMVKKRKQILAIQDTCHISYSHHSSMKDLSNIGGKNGSQGVILHSCLAVDPNKKHPEILGLLDQYIHHRTKKIDKNKIYSPKQKRWKESKLWEESSQRSDIKDSGVQIIEVMDRGGDIFDVIKNCLSLNHDFVIRATNDRLLNNSKEDKLFDLVGNLKPTGQIVLDIRKRPQQIPRKAKLNVSFSTIEIKGPKSRKDEIIRCNVVQVIEKNLPKGQEPLEWTLLTSVEVNSFEDACQIIEWYKCRWIIEEYHKGIKTGCGVEKKQLKTGKRLENYLGIANIVALRLLKLRDFARNMPEISAKKVIDPLKVDLLIKYNEIDKEDITIYEYYREVAKIGGFIGRKSDGEPGWQSLWEGEIELTKLFEGAKLMMKNNIYG